MKIQTKFSRMPIVLMFVGLLVVLWPLMRKGFFITDDGEWMVIRLSAFYQSLADGQFPVRLLGRLNNSYGYPVANFLYPGFLYVGSLLRLTGLSYVNAVKIILASSIIASSVLWLGAMRKRFSPHAQALGILSFVFAPYLLYDLYVRGSVGEIFALFCGVAVIVSLISDRSWPVAPFMGLLILAHNTVAAILFIPILSLMLITPRRTTMLLSAVIGVGMATFFWLPALAERSWVLFDTIRISDPSFYFVTLEKATLMGIAPVLAITVIFGHKMKLSVQEKLFIVFCIVGFIFALPLSRPLWEIRQFAGLVQFPYRFLILPVIFGPWLVARAVDSQKGWHVRIIMTLFVILLLWTGVSLRNTVRYVDRPDSYYETNEGTTTVAHEYLPRWVSVIPLARPVETLEILQGDATLSQRTFIGEQMEFTADAKESSLIQINKIYYPGWGVTMDSRLIPIAHDNPSGFLQITVPSGVHKMSVAFRETPFRFAADVVSLLSGIAYLLFMYRNRNYT